ncbi:MAG: TylF/MycF/NovP-related O-methyltransferase [bacterium]
MQDYNQDGLQSIHNNEFLEDPDFIRAYARGIKAAGCDYKWHWRVHIGLWAARHCQHIPGDFIECGVNAGFMSSAIMEYINWNGLNKTFFLLDTFKGIDENHVTAKELAEGILKKNKDLLLSHFYITDIKKVKENFSEWKNHEIIVGSIPETLSRVNTRQVAFMHIDMNCAQPELSSIQYFWDKLSDGAMVIFDDYAYRGYEQQKYALERFAEDKNVLIVSLPTGQGLLIKPPSPKNALGLISKVLNYF